jgi:transcription initiation factor IIE alpha subunit
MMTKKQIFDTMQKCLDEMRQQSESEQNQEGWVCVHCGKSTFETDYENLFSPQEHIGCALEKEKKNNLEFGEVAELKVPEIKHPEWLV